MLLLLAALNSGSAAAEIRMDRVLPVVPHALYDGISEAPPLNAARWRQLLFQVQLGSDRPVTKKRAADARQLKGLSGAIPIGLLDLEYVESETSRRLFATAALRDRSYRGASLRFVLSSQWIVADRGVVGVEIDFDDGLGWRPIEIDREVEVHYARTGTHALRLRDGEGRISPFQFQVEALVTPSPDDTTRVTGAPYLGSSASGDAFILLAPGHTELTQPAIVIEGFDLDDSMNWDELYALLNQENLIEDLRAQGFDAVVLNFDVATDPIQRNGLLVAELLTQIKAQVATPLALVGASMGGLCSRYALMHLEDQAIDHGVELFISFDTPHAGANIPLGVQQWLEFFEDQSTEAAYLLSRLDTPAARQMLVLHHDSTSGTNAFADPLRAQFLADLAAIGGYPQDPRLVAVANGSGIGTTQGYAPGAKLIDWFYDETFVEVTGNVWAINDHTPTVIFDGHLWVFIILSRDRTVSIGNGWPWDNAPGGRRNSLQQMDETAAPYGDIVALHPNHCFIPSISALHVATDDPFYDIAGDPQLLANTPFDAVYYPSENQDHVAVTPENKVWFLDELTPLVTSTPPALALPLRLEARPNPFNPAVTLSFELERSTAVSLDVFDSRGQRVARVLDAELLGPGLHELDWQPTLASGVYRVRLRAGDAETVRTVSLAK